MAIRTSALLPALLVATLVGMSASVSAQANAYREEARQVLVDFLGSDDHDIVRHAVVVIGKNCDPVWGTSALVDADVLSAEDDGTVTRALVALGRLGDLSGAEALAAKAEELAGDDAFLAAAAAEGIAHMLANNPEAGSMLVDAAKALAGHEDALVRQVAASALGYLPDGTGVDTLVTLAEDESDTVQAGAVAGLSMHGADASAGEALVRLCEVGALRDASDRVAEMRLLALGFVRGDQRDAAMSAAMAALGVGAEATRFAAITAAGMLATVENAEEHQGTLNQRLLEVGGDSNAMEKRLLQDLELHLALVSGNLVDLDLTRYPDIFPEGPGAKAAEEAAIAFARSRIDQDARPGDHPALDSARRRAAAKLADLENQGIMVLMQAAHYRADDAAQGRAIEAARTIVARKNEGKAEKSKVVEAINEHAERLRTRAEAEADRGKEFLDKQLTDLTVRMRDSKPKGAWHTQILAAGDYLRLIRKL